MYYVAINILPPSPFQAGLGGFAGIVIFQKLLEMTGFTAQL